VAVITFVMNQMRPHWTNFYIFQDIFVIDFYKLFVMLKLNN